MFRSAFVVPFTVALVLAAGGIVACGSDDDDDSPDPATVSAQPTQAASGGGSPTQSGGTRVTMVDFGYSPDSITAAVGQPVNLDVINNGQAPHTFTITGTVDSGTIAAGQSRAVSFTPTAAGTLTFLCTIHGAGAMSGRIVVQ